MTRFQEMLSNYVAYIQRITNEYYEEKLTNLTAPVIKVIKGRRFMKLVKADVDGSSISVHSFVEIENGKIWKPASYKAPALNFPRADLYDYDSIVKGTHMHGTR